MWVLVLVIDLDFNAKTKGEGKYQDRAEFLGMERHDWNDGEGGVGFDVVQQIEGAS